MGMVKQGIQKTEGKKMGGKPETIEKFLETRKLEGRAIL